MQTLKLSICAALTAASTLAFAYEPETTREQRMSNALDRYHDSRNPNPGPAARTEESIKRGVGKTGHAIKHGAQKAGHAVSRGAHKAGDALRNTGERIEDKVKSK